MREFSELKKDYDILVLAYYLVDSFFRSDAEQRLAKALIEHAKFNGMGLCEHCSLPIYRDGGYGGSGYWLHMPKDMKWENGHWDNMNGLYCSPEMWDDVSKRKYCKPKEVN